LSNQQSEAKPKRKKYSRRLTPKQQKLLIKLPENDHNIRKSAIEAGYAGSTVDSGAFYKSIRTHPKIKDIFDLDYIKREYKKTLKRCKKEKDNSNTLRSLEGMARIKGGFIEKTENKTELSVNKEDKIEVQAIRDRTLSHVKVSHN